MRGRYLLHGPQSRPKEPPDLRDCAGWQARQPSWHMRPAGDAGFGNARNDGEGPREPG